MNISYIYTPDHPLANIIKEKEMDHSYVYQKNVNGNFDFFDAITDISSEDLIFDLTILKDHEKEVWLDKITQNHKVVSDTTCNWGEYFNKAFENLVGQMATAFYSPKNKVEVFVHDEFIKGEITKFLESLALMPHYVENPGHGFTYPRTLSTLINEAYFALEDGLASKVDLDQAMRFGVNYPHGLFEWTQKVGAVPVVYLLQSLFEQTGDSRYCQAPLLKMEAML